MKAYSRDSLTKEQQASWPEKLAEHLLLTAGFQWL